MYLLVAAGLMLSVTVFSSVSRCPSFHLLGVSDLSPAYPESFLYLGEVVGEHVFFFFPIEVEGEAFARLHQSEAKLIFTLLVLISENTHIYFNKWHKGEISKLLFYTQKP